VLFAGHCRNEGLGRSVVQVAVSSAASKRADDSGCPEGRRGGERSSACATKRMHPTQAREIVASARGRVLRSVLRPVHVDPHYAPWSNPRWWGVRVGIAVGQTHASGRKPAPGLTRTNGARLAACHRFPVKREDRVTGSRKGRRSWPPSLRGSQELGFGCPHVVSAVAEVGRRRLVSNKLGKRAPKRAAGSSERGPSSSHRSAGETVGRRIE